MTEGHFLLIIVSVGAEFGTNMSSTVNNLDGIWGQVVMNMEAVSPETSELLLRGKGAAQRAQVSALFISGRALTGCSPKEQDLDYQSVTGYRWIHCESYGWIGNGLSLVTGTWQCRRSLTVYYHIDDCVGGGNSLKPSRR